MPTLLEDYAAALWAVAQAPPSSVEVRRAAILLADFLHCRDGAAPLPPRPDWAGGAVEDAAEAALSARTADRDDVHWASLTHPGSIVWPIVTELGPVLGAGGDRALAAARTGYAAIAGLAAALGPAHAAEFHSTATAGTVGAAATTAVLLDLAPGRWPDALGHALSVVGGSRGALLEYSGTRRFHSAHAVRTGIAATLAAAREVGATRHDAERHTGPLTGLDPDRLMIIEPALEDSSLRVFPTSGWNQIAYEAALVAATRAAGPITAIVVSTPGSAPPGVVEAVAAAIATADPSRVPTELIELRPDTGRTSVRVESDQIPAEISLTEPLDHPSRRADVTQLASLKWACLPIDAGARLERLADALTSGDPLPVFESAGSVRAP
jgi:hypothetical protein